MQGLDFVVAAYVLTWAVLAAYAGYVWRRFRRAERALWDETSGELMAERGHRRNLGGAA